MTPAVRAEGAWPETVFALLGLDALSNVALLGEVEKARVFLGRLFHAAFKASGSRSEGRIDSDSALPMTSGLGSTSRWLG